MALTDTDKLVSSALGTGTPTTEDVNAMESGTIIMDLGGRLLTKDMDDNLRLISEANRGSFPSPTESANTTRPTTVLGGEYWQTSDGTKYFFDGSNDLPLSDAGLSDGDEWVDTTDKANPVIKVYHADGSTSKVKEWVALVGDTMTGHLNMGTNHVTFSSSSYIGDIDGSVGINSGGNVVSVDTDGHGFILDKSKANVIKLYQNNLELYSAYGTDDQRSFLFNKYNGSGGMEFAVKDNTGTLIGKSLKVSDNPNDSQWQIGGRDIITRYTDIGTAYLDNESDAMLIDEDFFGDTKVGIQHTWSKFAFFSDDMAVVHFKFKLVSINITVPQNVKCSFKYDIARVWVDKISVLTKVINGAMLNCNIFLGNSSSNDSPVTEQRSELVGFTKQYWNPTLGSNGGGLELELHSLPARAGHSGESCNAAWVEGACVVQIERTGR